MRRFLIAALVLGAIGAGVFAFAANLDLNSAKITVFSNTLNSPSLTLAITPSDSVAAGTAFKGEATLAAQTVTAGGTVTYRFYNDGTCTTLHPTLHTTPDIQTVTDGAVPVSFAVTSTLSGTYSWKASYSGDGNNQPATSDCEVVTVTAADAEQLVITQQPSASTQAGTSFASQVKVEVHDAYDNVVTTSTATVHLAITSGTGDPLAVLDCAPNSNDQNASAGIATFSGCDIDKSGTGYTLTATSGTLTAAVSDAFAITAGPASKLVIAGATTQVAGETNDLTITAKDTLGNTATSYTGDKSLTFSGANASASPETQPTVKDKTGSSISFGSSTSIHFESGVATVSSGSNGVMTLYKVETADVAATDGSISAAGADRLTVVVSSAVASKLVFTQQPSSTSVAGDDFASQPVVEVRDAYGNVISGSTATVHLELTEETAPPGAILACSPSTNDEDAVAGVATFAECDVNKVAPAYTLLATSSGLTSATSTAFAITAGVADRLVVEGSATQVAGATNDLTITAKDEFGNTATGYTGDKSLTFSGAGNPDPLDGAGTKPKVTPVTGPAVAFGTAMTIHFSSGVATVSSGSNGVMTLYKVEVAHVAVTDGTIETEEEDELVVTVSHGAFNQLSLLLDSPQPNGGIFSGPTNTLTALDAYGNKITDFNASTTNVTITPNAPLTGVVSGLGTGNDNVLNKGTDFSGGVADLNSLGMKYTGNLETGKFTATAGAISGLSELVTIEAGAATKFVITGSTTQTAGTANNLTITAKDASGNTATGYDGDKSLTFSGANSSTGPVTAPTVTTATGSAISFGNTTTINFVDGVATVSGGNNGVMVLYKAEVAVISATQGSITTTGGDQLTVTVSAAAAGQLVFAVQPSDGETDVSISPAVQVRVEDSFGNLVTTVTSVSMAIDNNAGPGAVLFGGGPVATVSGVATFSNLQINLPGTGYTLKATISGGIEETSASFDITAGQA